MFVQRSTPDRLRRPTAMEEAGKVGRKGENYVILTRQLLTQEIEARVAAHVTNILDRVDKLAARGIDPAAIGSMYLNGRPALVPVR